MTNVEHSEQAIKPNIGHSVRSGNATVLNIQVLVVKLYLYRYFELLVRQFGCTPRAPPEGTKFLRLR